MTKLTFTHLFLITLFVFEGLFSYSQEFDWIRTGGPWGGIGYDVRIDPKDPNRIYVTDQWAGNHKSVDGGRNWYPNNNGITSRFGSTSESIPIFCLTIDPTHTNNIWCGTFENRGIYKSTDYGENWELKINGIPDFECGITFRGFRIRPDNSDIIFCGVEVPCCQDEIPEGKSAASKGKIFKTIDGGENWYEVLNSEALVRHILINPENPDIMYASTGIFDRDCVNEEGVWKSIDGGESWFHANNGLIDLTVGGLCLDPKDPDVLWACTGREPGFGGIYTGQIYKTTNGAQSWTKVYDPQEDPDPIHIPGVIHSIIVSQQNSNKIIAATSNYLVISYDFGNSWELRRIDISGVSTGIPVGIAIHPKNDSIIYTNSYSGGVFYTEDDGENWENGSKGYTGAEMFENIVDPDNPRRLISIGRAGIAKSDNAGNTWSGAGHIFKGTNGQGEGPVEEYTKIEINPINKNSLLAAHFTLPFLLKTTDWMNWEVIYDFRKLGIPELHGIGDIKYIKNDSNNLFMGVRYYTLPYIMDRPSHYDPNIISYGMLKSLDAGKSWEFVNNGLEETTKNIQCIETHPINKDIAYIGVYGFGIFKTTDGGQSWEPKNNGLNSFLVADINICEEDPSIIYAGMEMGGIYKSVDGGEKWELIVYGMDPEASIRSIVIHPLDRNRIFASDWFSGVYYSGNGGNNWEQINNGLSQRSIQNLAISNDGNILYAATQGAGVFRLPLKEFEPEINSVLPDTIELITIYQGDSLLFNVDAYDIDDENLNYQWTIDGQDIVSEENPVFQFYSDTLETGIYYLTGSFDDSITTKEVNWQIQILPQNTTDIESFTVNNHLDFNVYPNPSKGQLNCEIGTTEYNNLILKLINSMGQVIETRSIKNSTLKHTESFNLFQLQKGIYYLVIYNEDFQQSKKIMIQ